MTAQDIKTGICDIILDREDQDLLYKYKWCVKKDGYCSAHLPRSIEKVLLHRLIAERMYGDIKGKIIDHINQDTTDNRRCNLRLADRTINSLNSKLKCNSKCGYWCVYQQKLTKKWASFVGGGRKRKHLGTFDTVEQAARAHDIEAKRRYGELARLNFSNE